MNKSFLKKIEYMQNKIKGYHKKTGSNATCLFMSWIYETSTISALKGL